MIGLALASPPLRRCGGAAFDELTTANLILALLVDRMTPVADATPVASWTDFSTSNNPAVQATGVRQPLYKVGVQNGLPGLLFDGGNDAMATASFGMSTFTIFLVTRLTGTTGMLYEQSANVNSSGNGVWLYGHDNDTIKASRTPGSASSYNLAANWSVDNALKVITHQMDGTHAGHGLRINGAAQSLSAVSSGAPGSGTATDVLYVGARAGTTLNCNGYFHALMVCSPCLTVGEMTTVEAGLMARWGA